MKSRKPFFLRLPVAAVIVALMILPVLIVGQGFHSDWDQPFLFTCPLGQTLKNIYSVHDNRREDRRWRFSCANGPGGCQVRDCHWTGGLISLSLYLCVSLCLSFSVVALSVSLFLSSIRYLSLFVKRTDLYICYGEYF